MHIIRIRLAFLDFDVTGDVIHRAGPVKSDKGNDIFEPVWLHAHQGRAHTRTFNLKHAGCLAFTQDLIGFTIIQRHLQDIDILAFGTLDIFNRFLHHGHRFQAQKIEFQQACLFNIFHIELRHGHIR